MLHEGSVELATYEIAWLGFMAWEMAGLLSGLRGKTEKFHTKFFSRTTESLSGAAASL